MLYKGDRILINLITKFINLKLRLGDHCILPNKFTDDM
jgi:hypothetical protein